MIPFIDLATDKNIEKQISKEILQVIKSKSYILGERLEKFEKDFASFLGARYVIGVGNGTDALRLSLRALGIGRGDKVLTVAFTSPFTAISIVEEGAVPVFCDVDDKTFTIDFKDAQSKIDKKVKAILPVHIYGNPCNVESLVKFAKHNKLKIIEDACQAHGALWRGKNIGNFGDLAGFSFYPTKNLGALGDGGAIVTNNKQLAERVRALRHGGQIKRFWHEYPGMNSRLDEIHAAILSIKLRYLKRDNRKRKLIVEKYKKGLSGLPVEFQENFNYADSANHLFVIKTDKRDALRDFLKRKKIVSDVYYPYPVHLQTAFKGFKGGNLKTTEKLCRELLALPLFPTLTSSDQKLVIKSIRKFFGYI